VITSVSAFPFVRAVARAMAGPGVEVAPVRNRFFGETVTVAGLLTARVVVASVRRSGRGWGRVVLPSVMFNYRGVTLDGYTRGRIGRTLGMRVAAAGTAEDLAGVLGVL
jgi:NifB/MoaA-like Fe-S oxidoreductase